MIATHLGNFVDSPHCATRAHCKACLTKPQWHEAMGQRYTMPTMGTCPHGVTLATIGQAPPPVAKFTPPAAPTVDERARADARADVCRGCQHMKRISRTRRGWPVDRVQCGKCGCAGLSLIHGQCPDGLWPGAIGPAPVPPLEPDAPPVAVMQPERQVPRSTLLLPPRNPRKPPPNNGATASGPQPLVLKCNLCPGDILMLTAAVRDLHKAHPGKYLTAVSTTAPELWEHNPYIAPGVGIRTPGVRKLEMHYPLIDSSNQLPYHFVHGYRMNLEEQLGINIPPSAFGGDVHLGDDERGWMNQVEETFGHAGPYWIMMAGGKYDYTAKWWNPQHYQAVVDHFAGRVTFVQCGDKQHWHPQLRGALNLVGKTTIRQFVRLMYHAQGVVCPVTFAMHLAAAVPTTDGRLRPCVVISGGREPVHWESYPGHQFLHTIGMLKCCAGGACWKSRAQKMNDGDKKNSDGLCEQPVEIMGNYRINGAKHDRVAIPRCMDMITPHHVITAIEGYLACR